MKIVRERFPDAADEPLASSVLNEQELLLFIGNSRHDPNVIDFGGGVKDYPLRLLSKMETKMLASIIGCTQKRAREIIGLSNV